MALVFLCLWLFSERYHDLFWAPGRAARPRGVAKGANRDDESRRAGLKPVRAVEFACLQLHPGEARLRGGLLSRTFRERFDQLHRPHTLLHGGCLQVVISSAVVTFGYSFNHEGV